MAGEIVVGKVVSPEELPHGVFWTPQRLAAVKPKPLPVARVAVAGSRERRKAPPPVTRVARTTWHRGQLEEPAPHVEPMIAGALGVNQPLSYPYRTIGKLIFSQGFENFYSGSAALISPNVLLTAAHCVYDGGIWSSNMTFFPSNSSRLTTDPMFSFGYHSLACWSSWIDSDPLGGSSNDYNYSRDYAMVWIDAAPGKELGYLALEFFEGDGGGWPSLEGQRWEAVGFPALPDPPFDAYTMYHTVGSFVSGDHPDVIGMNNDNMRDGSSGGPWLTSLAGRYVNGVTSHNRHGEDPFNSYSPFFTSKVYDLFQYISDPANR